MSYYNETMSNVDAEEYGELSIGRELMVIADELVRVRSIDGLIAVSKICSEMINKGVDDGNLKCYYSFVSISTYTSSAVEGIKTGKSTEEIMSSWQRPEPNDFTKNKK